MKKRLLAGLLTCVMLFSLLPATVLAEEFGGTDDSIEVEETTESVEEQPVVDTEGTEDTEELPADDEEVEEPAEFPVVLADAETQTEAELSDGINVITEGAENAVYTVDGGKAVALKGTEEAPITFTNCTFNISADTMHINGSGVGYNGETRTRFGVGQYVTFNGCVFNVTDGGTTSSSGNDACIEFFGPEITFNNSSITGTDWQGQFLGLYGSAKVTFNSSTIATTGNTGGWSYAMYGASVLNLNDSTMTATGMKRAEGGSNVNAFYSGDLRTNYDAINIKNSTINFSDNNGGGFAINRVNIHVEDSDIIVCDNAGNATNSGVWYVKNSDIKMNGNRTHGWSHISDQVENSTIEILHNGYAGYYIAADSSFTNCIADIRCNGEKYLSYSAGDTWLNTHTLTLKNCEHVWLGAVGRKGSVTAENCPYVVASDLYENKTKGNTEPVLTDVELSEQDEHMLFLNRNKPFDYARGDTEEGKVGNNDADLFEDVEKAVAIGANTAKIGTLTTAQLSHHSYDWEKGEITDRATPSAYGVIQYTCTDVCADRTTWTEAHEDSFDCPGTYVYAPLIGVTYIANAGGDVVTNMPESANDLAYGSKLYTTVPVRDSGTYDYSWTFTGWYKDENCTEKIDENAELKDNWTIVYAGWEKKEKPAPIVPEWDTSKSKTATNLEKNAAGEYTSDVTLSLPSAEEQLVSDVVFVLDKSTSAYIEQQALTMLSNLKTQIENTGAKINVGVVIFNKQANVTDFMDLSTQYEDIKVAIEQKISSGTNTHAGLLAGKAMLDEDTSVDASRKYLIFVSDAVTYMYNEEPTVTAWTFKADVFANWAGPDNWNSKYGSNEPPENWTTWLEEIGKQIDAQGAKYEYSYGGTVMEATPEENWQTYANSIDKALYLTNEVYQAAKSEGYHCYAMTADQNRGTQYTWGPDFMDYLAGNEEVSFANIQNDIYYLLSAGSKVVDVIGKGTYGTTNKFAYDFDFISNAKNLTLTVNGEKLDVEDLTEPDLYMSDPFETARYGFGKTSASIPGGYPYVLHYYAKGQDGQSDECFVWDINVPVSNFERVQLTYTVKLTNPQTEIGVYGEYDEDGWKWSSENEEAEDRKQVQVTLDSLYTNKSATLYPIDSNGNEVQPEDFFRPCVSYEVTNEPTGTLKVTKYVLGANPDPKQEFSFKVTIGDATETFTLTNGKTKTFTGLSLNAAYQVVETSSGNYKPNYFNATGKITGASGSDSAVVVNVPNNTSALFISKTVKNSTTSEKFTFTVDFDRTVNGILRYTDSTEEKTFTKGDTVELSSGNSAVIYGLPAGVKYTVTETPVTNFTASSVTTGVAGTVANNVATGEIAGGEIKGVHYTNTYTKPSSPGGSTGGGGGGGGSTVLNTDDHYSYIIGYKDGYVRPYGTITRGEVATIFFRLLTDEARDKYWSQTNDYSDCNSELWCNNAISTLTNMGIIDGFTDGTFRPYGKITRAQFAKIAVGFFETTTKEYQGYYSDVPENAWFTDYVEAASRVGLIQGFEDGTFRPNTNITRAQACVIVNRALGRKPDEDHLLSERQMITWPDNNPGDWYYADMQEATNSHDYTWLTKGTDKKYMEDWTKKLEQRDWAAFEHAWSTSHSAPGGEVVK